MSDISTLGNFGASPAITLAAQPRLLHPQASAPNNESKKIDKSARDFESILLGSWLKQAETSFATLPGGDDEDEDPGKEQFQGMAMQSLGDSMTASGGIGIAKMISRQLHKTEDAQELESSKGAKPSPAIMNK